MKRSDVPALSLAALLAASALNHVRNPGFYYAVVPPQLCSDKGRGKGILTRKQWVLASAVPEALAAVGLLLPATRRAAATSTAVMFVGFTAGHCSALQHAFGPQGSSAAKRIHLARLPLQIPLVVWAWRARTA